MDFDTKKEFFRKNFDKLKKKCKDKKILLYGAGLFLDKILENYDFSGFSVVGISDLKFSGKKGLYKNYKIIDPKKIPQLKIDLIIVTLINFSQVELQLKKLTNAKIVSILPSLKEQKKEVFKNYAKVIEKIKDKKKIRVGFLVSETAKWQYDSLYRKFLQEELFEPQVLITKRSDKKYNEEEFFNLYNFFKNQNIEPIQVFDNKNNKFLDINDFNLDLIFYEQPWGIDYCQNILHTSENSLSFYCPYAISESSFVFDKTKDFFSLLYCHFLVDESAKKQYLKFDKTLNNLYVVSHPKLDSIINKEKKQTKTKTIIFAPHHSFSEKSLNWATFLWSGEVILGLAKKFSNFNWILKPHPGFYDKLLSDTNYKKENLDNFLSQWKKIGSIETGGNYFNLFLSSDLLITDCGSFVVEYLFSKNPCIYLIKNNLKNHSKLNQKIIKNYYCAKNKKDLEDWFNRIIIQKEDNLEPKRLKLIKNLNIGLSTDNILNLIKEKLQDKL